MSIKHYLAFLGLLAAIGMTAGAAMEPGASEDSDTSVESSPGDDDLQSQRSTSSITQTT